MRAVDTKVLVRIIARDVPEETAAAEAFINSGAWVSTLVLMECVWVLARLYQRTPKELFDTVEAVLMHEKLVLQDPATVAAALQQFRLRPALGFSDCVILQSAIQAGHLPLGTFDRALAKCEGTQRL